MLTAEFRDIKVNVSYCCPLLGLKVWATSPSQRGHFEWGLTEKDLKHIRKEKGHFSQDNKRVSRKPLLILVLMEGKCCSVQEPVGRWPSGLGDWDMRLTKKMRPSSQVVVFSTIFQQDKPGLLGEMPYFRPGAGNIDEPRASCSAKKKC